MPRSYATLTLTLTAAPVLGESSRIAANGNYIKTPEIKWFMNVSELWRTSIGGAAGIRTLDELLTHTHFPGERLRPLGHRSAYRWKSVALGRDRGFRKACVCASLRPMKKILLSALALTLMAASPSPVPLAPSEIVAAAPKADWVAISPRDLMVMTLAPDAKGKARRVVIQLMPAPFSQGWVSNMRTLAAASWWDGTTINRVQDNYVVQWGDASEKKALPVGLATVDQTAYEIGSGELSLIRPTLFDPWNRPNVTAKALPLKPPRSIDEAATSLDKHIEALGEAIAAGRLGDGYSPLVGFSKGFAVGWLIGGGRNEPTAWPVHCYGMVGVGRDMPPNTGTGAELYTVIGHAPRHLDRNFALVGRVIEGIEHLSSLPRGTGALGFYETPEERVAIQSIRIADSLPAADQPRFEYLSTESSSFAAYAGARANRRDAFFITPAGGADICNIPVPVRRLKE
jgi:cyclophilin family peptidyl-prolyl cis-trans isomerase